MHPYQPRSVTLLRIVSRDEWRLKLYSIALDRAAFDEARFRRGLEMALESLPAPARTTSRPGVGFCILHQGRGADYVVLAWWDRENELPLRVFVSTSADPEWRPARGSESVCVWDLEVIGFERDAYVRTVLAEPAVPVQAYLDALASDMAALPYEGDRS
jgi:hypothetical protein